MKSGCHISMFGSSLVSAYWNGAATYYRGMVRALHERGHSITFYEPDAYERQAHRDIADPQWAEVVVYSAVDEMAVYKCLEQTRQADIIIKCSGVGVFDELLECEILNLHNAGRLVGFWDVDAPATLDRIEQKADDPFNRLIPRYDFVLTYGGGDRVVRKYLDHGARNCVPIYNALDPSTHYRVAPDKRFAGQLGFLGNRLPDREARVEEFFINGANSSPSSQYLLGGNGWGDKPMPRNVKYCGHVSTNEHNVFNSTPLAILNVDRDSMASYGFSPPTRIFEAAGAGACIITDEWEGIEMFLEPDKEVLVAANGDAVREHLSALTISRARLVGSAALKRVSSQHTYRHRAEQFEIVLGIANEQRRTGQ